MKHRTKRRNVNNCGKTIRMLKRIGLLNVSFSLGFLFLLFNFFFKYLDGDLGGYHNVKKAYMKQKHRLIWERRHGPVGSGKKKSSELDE